MVLRSRIYVRLSRPRRYARRPNWLAEYGRALAAARVRFSVAQRIPNRRFPIAYSDVGLPSAPATTVLLV